MNKHFRTSRPSFATGLGILLGALSFACGASTELSVDFVDPAWDGKNVPENKVCKKFDGNGSSPAIKISGLPAGTTAVEVSFSDDSYARMRNGGHGVLRFRVATGQSEVELPSVPGETEELPDGVTMVAAHKGVRGTPGAYLAPCSGWNGNWYSAHVKALGSGGTLAEGNIKLGKF